MSAPKYTRFLSECFIYDPGSRSGLSGDEIYGVYLSWCILNDEKPGASTALWAAMTQLGHVRQTYSVGRRWLGLTMTGPAVVDYILSSRPSLVCTLSKVAF